MDYKILIAGFGGQGILFSGKVIANTGLMLEKEVSWLPSYGPETTKLVHQSYLHQTY